MLLTLTLHRTITLLATAYAIGFVSAIILVH